MVHNKTYLDYSGLQEYDQLIKGYSDEADEALSERLEEVATHVIGTGVTFSNNTLQIGYMFDSSGSKRDFSFSGTQLLIEWKEVLNG